MSAPRKIAIVLESKDVTSGQVRRMIAAMLVQVARDFGPVHDIPTPEIRQFTTESEVPADWDLGVFLPSADLANALGYHSETPGGRKFFRVFTDGQTIHESEETFSHEVLELLLNPGVNRWAQSPAGDLWPIEACDAVQGQWYEIDLGDGGEPVRVADFVTPDFFDYFPIAGARFNWNQTIPVRAAFTCGPYGYTVKMIKGETSQIGGAEWAGPNPKKAHPAARTAQLLGACHGIS